MSMSLVERINGFCIDLKSNTWLRGEYVDELKEKWFNDYSFEFDGTWPQIGTILSRGRDIQLVFEKTVKEFINHRDMEHFIQVGKIEYYARRSYPDIA